MKPVRAAAALLAASLLAPAASAGDGDPSVDRVPVADFETDEGMERFDSFGGTIRRVAGGPDAPGGFLEWTIAAGETTALYLRIPPVDGTACSVLRFRARLSGARPGVLLARVSTTEDDYAQARVRGVGLEWRTFEVPIPAMARAGAFDPRTIHEVSLVVWGPKAGGYHVDDVEFVRASPAPAPPAAPPAPPAKAPAGKGSAKAPVRVVVADFEDPSCEDWVEADPETAGRVPAEKPGESAVLRWTTRANGETSSVDLSGVPVDIREFRLLRFRVRADRDLPLRVDVRFCNTVRNVIGMEFVGVKREWKAVSMRIPDMREMGRFDPTRVREIAFIVFEPADATLFFDDVELEAQPGGWTLTDAERMAQAFGEERARKAKKVATKHFDVWSDSAAALSKFPEGLEKAYDFAKRVLGTAEMAEKLPIYIFQNPSLYVDFCVRRVGWSKEAAERTAGHGSGRYFATYYQGPEAPTVVHELTHSIFHRTQGPWGGSWFQEGVAVFVEHRWQRQSAAEVFSSRLRNGQFYPLRKFLALPSLVAQDDVKGGAGTADSLYLQAGAFYEFLLRGPMAPQWPSMQQHLATEVVDDEALPARFEFLAGRKLEEIEKAWIAWGSDPPKLKDEKR